VGILANGFRDTLGVFKTYGATASNNAYPSAGLANFARTGAMRNITAGEGITSPLVSRPSGNRHPVAWMMPQKAGALAARNTMIGSGSVAASALAVKLAQADLTGSGDLTAVGGLIVQLVADLVGSGDISDADVQAFLAAVASIGGSGGISDAEATGLGELVAALIGSGTTGGSTATGIGELSADLVVTGTGLTTANVGQAVWAAVAASNNASGTMGEKLNAASSAGDPWGTSLPGSYPAGSAGAILGRYLADVWRRLGLGATQTTTKVGSVTTITDGDLTLEITENLDGSVTVERQ
jgi:hypothetical protein